MSTAPTRTARARAAAAPAILSTLVAAGLLGVGTAAHADGIDGVAITNRSTPDTLIDEPDRVREFKTESQLSYGAADPDHASITHRMAWASAQRVEPGGPTVALIWGKYVDYSIGFQVDDPLDRGYALSFDTLMRGYLTDRWHGNSGTGVSMIFSAGTLLSASLDSASGSVTLPELATDVDVAVATDTEPFVNLLVASAGHVDAGHYVGSQFFTLNFSTAGANTQAAFQNFNTGEAAVRFGAALDSPRFGYAGYPGADGEAAADLGHFVTVQVDYDVAPVPEPATGGLLITGLAGLVGWTRRRRSAVV